MFTDRFKFSLKPNRWTRILKSVREDGCDLIDLAISNPSAAGFAWDAGTLANALGNAEIARYSPSPRGNANARQAVADFYKNTHHCALAPEQIHLTASTSEAYGWLLKLLTNPGDNILMPTPSYPLIAFLCGMEAVETRDYNLVFRDNRWQIDFDSLAVACNEKTKAVFCVSPNNPTGNLPSQSERERLLQFARERQLALVVDEVFLEYLEPSFHGETFANVQNSNSETQLVFVLGGLSKTAALPQIKAGWIITCGNEKLRDEALARLDFIADTFLSLSTPAALAVPVLLKAAPAMRERINARLNNNFELLKNWCARSRDGRFLLPREGGWYGIVRLPKGIDEETLCTDLLRHGNVIVHPGYFYDLENRDGAHLVFSLLSPSDFFEKAFPLINYAIARN